MNKTLCALISLAVLGGCSEETKVPSSLETITGIPISADYFPNQGCYFTIKTNDEKIILIGPYSAFISGRKSTMATAIVKSEIQDGDNEPITVKGRYDPEEKGLFLTQSITANGYTVDF